MRHLALLALVLFASLLPAQPLPCLIGDDGFNLGCCTFPQPNFPMFPQVQENGKSACIRDCNLEMEHGVSISMSPPIFVTCDIAVIQIGITPSTVTGPGYSGTLLAKYSRTWTEPTAIGTVRQVWRFLVNGELNANPTSVGLAGCPYPLSLPATGGLVHFWGSIDYACDGTSPVGTNPWRIRMDLNHGPNCLQYAPWTTYAGALPAGAPDRSYHIVAPANFTFAPVPAPSGPMPGEAVRGSRLTPGAGLVCFGEARVSPNSILQNVMQNCLCGAITPVLGPWTHQNLNGFATCAGAGSPFVNIPLPGTPFPTGFVTMSLGFYTPTTASFGFPENREVLIHWGVLQYTDLCSPVNFNIHVVHGVTTQNHFGVPFSTTPVVTPFNVWMDLSNHKNPATAFTFPGGTPIFGSLSYSDEVWNLNL